MIKNIKIYGERNSGTTFLNKLLQENIFNINILSPYYKGDYGWKHGYPDIKYFDNIKETLFIFIIRDLEPWLISMFKNNYHYKKPVDIENFLLNPLNIFEPRKDHDVNLNLEEHGNVIDIRYKKINSYFEFIKKVENAVIINLENIQIDEGKNFINFLNKKYNIAINENLKPILKHTKTKEDNIKNREYNIILPKNIIEEKQNEELEKFVESLKTNYFIK